MKMRSSPTSVGSPLCPPHLQPLGIDFVSCPSPSVGYPCLGYKAFPCPSYRTSAFPCFPGPLPAFSVPVPSPTYFWALFLQDFSNLELVFPLLPGSAFFFSGK